MPNFVKVDYIPNQTMVTAENLNAIQDEIVKLATDGIPGPIGPVGPEGPMGPIGPQGLKGDKGDRGEALSIKKVYESKDAMNLELAHAQEGEIVLVAGGVTPEEGNVYVKSRREFVLITNVGKLTGTVVGPQGATGPQGPKGEQGPAGVAGPAGPAGAVGPKGAKGDTGAKGDQGPKGDAGAAGDKIYRYKAVGGHDIWIVSDKESIEANISGSDVTVTDAKGGKIFAIQAKIPSAAVGSTGKCTIKHLMGADHDNDFVVPHVQVVTNQAGSRTVKMDVAAKIDDVEADKIEISNLTPNQDAWVSLRLI